MPKVTDAARPSTLNRFARDIHTLSGRGPNPGELLPFPPSTGKAAMSLGDIFPASDIQAIQRNGSISFHAVGDSGVGSAEQHMVADAMAGEIDHDRPEHGPAFLLHLGDVIYGPDKVAEYANKFYRPYDRYGNPIFAIPGNHDGEVHSDQDHSSLEAYLANFCQPKGKQPPMAVSAGRTMPHQPGPYWRLTCPFVDIIGLYSGTGENFGAIAHKEIGDSQKVWLAATLKDVAAERSKKKQAMVIAVHHPPYANGFKATHIGHPGNPEMLQDIDDCCAQAGVFPDAVLSAHAHNYQRYLRTQTARGEQRTVPYLIAGGGGIHTQAVPLPLNTTSPDGLVHYGNGATSYGYLTVTVSATALTSAFRQVAGGQATLFEAVTVDLRTGKLN